MPSLMGFLNPFNRGKKKSFFEAITITDIFPKSESDIFKGLSTNIKNMQSVVGDPTFILYIKSFLDDSATRIRTAYQTFNKTFQKESKKIAKNWPLAREAYEFAEKTISKNDFDKMHKLHEKLINLRKKVEEDKKKIDTEVQGKRKGLDTLAENTDKRLTEIYDETHKINKELEEKEESLKKFQADRGSKITEKLKEVRKSFQEKTDQLKKIRDDAPEDLKKYVESRNSQKDKDKLLDAAYDWGPATLRFDARKAKAAYEKYEEKHKKDIDDLKDEKYKHEQKFLNLEMSKIGSYGEGKFAEFKDVISDLDAKISILEEEIKKLEGERKKLEDELKKAMSELNKETQAIQEEAKGQSFVKYLGLLKEFYEVEKKLQPNSYSLKKYYGEVLASVTAILKDTEAVFSKATSIPAQLQNDINQTLRGDFKYFDGGKSPLIIILAKVKYFFEKIKTECEDRLEKWNKSSADFSSVVKKFPRAEAFKIEMARRAAYEKKHPLP